MKKGITREMIEKAKAQGWYTSEAARNLGVAPTSIIKACRRFDISLSRHSFDPYSVSNRGPEASDTRTKTWSASPAAISRYLNQKTLAGACAGK